MAGSEASESEVLVGEVVGEAREAGTAADVGDLVLRRDLARDVHPVLVYLASLSEGSRRTIRDSLEKIAGIISRGEVGALNVAWHELRYQHTAYIRSQLAAAYAPATANKMLSALRGVLKECFRLGYMSAEDYERARDLPSVRGSSISPGRSLSRDELAGLFRFCKKTDKKVQGARDAALVAVLYGCGLRRGEVVALDLSDYDGKTGELKIRRGKGKKDRISYATGGSGGAIEGWLAFRGREDGPLFNPINKGGKVQDRRMSDQAVYNILRRLAREIKSKNFAPHDMRRTFIGDLLDAGVDLSSAQQLAGHSNPQTTARYDRRGERARKQAAARLDVPYDSTAPAGSRWRISR